MTLHMTNLLYCVKNVLHFILDTDCLSEKLRSPVVTVRFILIILRGLTPLTTTMGKFHT